MEFASNNVDLINIIQILIDKGAMLYGRTLRNFLINHDISKINMYLPSDEVIEEMTMFQKYFEYSIELKKEQFKFHFSTFNKNKSIWTINDTEIWFTIVKPKFKKEINNLYLSKHGISALHGSKFKSIQVLKLLRKINNKPDYNYKLINVMTEWIKYFLTQDNIIYGSWPSRYITSNNKKDMKRDIDIVTNDITSINNLMRALKVSGLCKSNINDEYDIPSLNVEINCETYLNFDIHKKSKNDSADAFYNNLKMTDEYLTANYQLDNINYITNMLLIFNDLFHDRYTLIFPITTKISTNVSDLRLIVKPVMFSLERTVDYSYLEFCNKHFMTLEDLQSKEDCCRNWHEVNEELSFPPMVFQFGKKNMCLHCYHKHVYATNKKSKPMQ